MRELPHPQNPRGWYRALYSDELAPREARPVDLLGRELVAYRGEDGRVRVTDAYCPHLGAHLGHGGRVEGDTIICPFHGWRWDGESGACREIPYAKRIPAAAKLGAWPTRELNGYVIFWYDPDGGVPDFDIPLIPETEDPDFELYKRVEWTLDSHIQEIYENVVDTQHFVTLHGMEVSAISWEPIDGKNDPTVRLRVEFARDNQAQSDEGGETKIESFMYGPGLQVTRLRGRLEGISVNSLAPTNDGRVLVTHAYYVRRRGGRSSRSEVEAFWDYYMKDHELDFNIWNHKTYWKNPVLAAEDGDIAGFRRWFRQFYPRSERGGSDESEVRHG